MVATYWHGSETAIPNFYTTVILWVNSLLSVGSGVLTYISEEARPRLFHKEGGIHALDLLHKEARQQEPTIDAFLSRHSLHKQGPAEPDAEPEYTSKNFVRLRGDAIVAVVILKGMISSYFQLYTVPGTSSQRRSGKLSLHVI